MRWDLHLCLWDLRQWTGAQCIQVLQSAPWVISLELLRSQPLVERKDHQILKESLPSILALESNVISHNMTYSFSWAMLKEILLPISGSLRSWHITTSLLVSTCQQHILEKVPLKWFLLVDMNIKQKHFNKHFLKIYGLKKYGTF